MRGKKIHLTILALAVVLIPPWFLVFTDEGARISDNVLLWITGEPSLELNIPKLAPYITPEQVRQVFPDLEWQCETRETAFGDQLCAATIGNFNQYPSRYVSFFFIDNSLNAMKLVYRSSYHSQVLGHMIQQLGQPENSATAMQEGPDLAALLEWNTGNGRVLMKKQLAEEDEPALLWLAPPRRS